MKRFPEEVNLMIKVGVFGNLEEAFDLLAFKFYVCFHCSQYLPFVKARDRVPN